MNRMHHRRKRVRDMLRRREPIRMPRRRRRGRRGRICRRVFLFVRRVGRFGEGVRSCGLLLWDGRGRREEDDARSRLVLHPLGVDGKEWAEEVVPYRARADIGSNGGPEEEELEEWVKSRCL